MIILKYRLLPQHKFKQMGKSRLYNKSDHASTNDRRIFPTKLIPENSQIRADLGTAIDTRLESILPSVINCSISHRYNAITKAIYEACSEVLKPPRKKSQYWFDNGDEQIDHLLSKRRELCKKYLQNKTKTLSKTTRKQKMQSGKL